MVQYTVFDQLKQRHLKGQLRKETGTGSPPEALSAFSAFLLGAVSKCVATILTYPAIRWMVNSFYPSCKQINCIRHCILFFFVIYGLKEGFLRSIASIVVICVAHFSI